MSVFNNVAKLQYESTVGGLPGWVFLLLFIGTLLYCKFTQTYNDFETGEEKKMGWTLSTVIALLVTFIVFVSDWFRKGMFGARTKLYKNQGMNNSTAKATAMQTQQFSDLSSKINGLNIKRGI